jgi:hypothetical protein
MPTLKNTRSAGLEVLKGAPHGARVFCGYFRQCPYFVPYSLLLFYMTFIV